MSLLHRASSAPLTFERIPSAAATHFAPDFPRTWRWSGHPVAGAVSIRLAAPLDEGGGGVAVFVQRRLPATQFADKSPFVVAAMIDNLAVDMAGEARRRIARIRGSV